MSTTFKTTSLKTGAATVCAAALLAGAALLSPLSLGLTPTATAQTQAGLDRVVLISGEIVIGEVISETDSQIVVLIKKPGFPDIRRTISASQVLQVYKDADDIQTGSDPKAPAGLEIDSMPEDAAKVLRIELSGELGIDITDTPLNRIFEQADILFNDKEERMVDGEPTMVVKEEYRDQHVIIIDYDMSTDSKWGFQGVTTAEWFAPILERELLAGRKIVFWIEEGSDGAAFFPWVSPDIYFKPSAEIYFTGDLETFSIGNQMVDEKQISLRIAHAEGLAGTGGYADIASDVIPAMVRSKYWLAYRMVGGKPEFINSKPTPQQELDGFILLTDDARNPQYNDKSPMSLAPDLLVVDAQLAADLGLSGPPSSSLDDIMADMGIDYYVEFENNTAEAELEDWADELDRALKLGQIRGEFHRSFQVNMDRLRAATTTHAYRSASSAVIRDINRWIRLLERYDEVLDRGGNIRAELNTIKRRINDGQDFNLSETLARQR